MAAKYSPEEIQNLESLFKNLKAGLDKNYYDLMIEMKKLFLNKNDLVLDFNTPTIFISDKDSYSGIKEIHTLITFKMRCFYESYRGEIRIESEKLPDKKEMYNVTTKFTIWEDKISYKDVIREIHSNFMKSAQVPYHQQSFFTKQCLEYFKRTISKFQKASEEFDLPD